MTPFGLLRALAPALASLFLPLGQAAAQAPAPAESERIMFPFNPPIDQVLRYRVVKTTAGTVSPPPAELEQELTYSRIPGGYLLEIATIKITRGERTFTPVDLPVLMIGPEDLIALSRPITLRLGDAGRVVGIHDWDAVRETIRAIPDRVAAEMPAGDRERMRDVISRGLDPVTQVSAEGAIAFIAKEWPPMLTYGAGSFEIGKTVTTRNRYFMFDGQVPVSLLHDVLVERTPDGGLVLTELQHTDREDFREAWQRYSANLPPEMAALREADLRRMTQLNRNSTTQVVLDAAGVLRSGYWEVRMERDGMIEESTRVEFQRLE